VNGRLDPVRCTGKVVKKLTVQHSRWLAEWEDDSNSSAYKELKAAYKKYVTSKGTEIPKAWEEVSINLYPRQKHHTHRINTIDTSLARMQSKSLDSRLCIHQKFQEAIATGAAGNVLKNITNTCPPRSSEGSAAANGTAVPTMHTPSFAVEALALGLKGGVKKVSAYDHKLSYIYTVATEH